MAKVTIEDISRSTGLSRGTVSRALNDRPDISETTKQRVLEACRKLNYVPSHAARSLATGRNFAIAVIVDQSWPAQSAALVRGVVRKAAQIGYVVQLVDLDNAAGAELPDALQTDRIDGVLITSAMPPAALGHLRDLLGARPLVACCSGLQGEAHVDCILPDEREAGRLLARHLLNVEGRALCYLHRPDRPDLEERLEGFREICGERGVDARERILVTSGTDSDLPRLRDALANARAVGACDDLLAWQAAGWLGRLERVVGRDVALAGQGNTPLCLQVSPQLTSVDLAGEEIGRRAMETLAQRISDARQDTPATIRITPTIVPRASSDLGHRS